MLPIDKHA